MKKIFDTLAGDVFVFGYSVPIMWLIAGGFLLAGAGIRAVTLTMIAALILLTLYVMPAMASV